MDIREQTDAQFGHLSDDELRAAASNPSMPPRLLPALKEELRSRRAGAAADRQPWQQTPAAAVVQFPTTMRVVVTDVDISFGHMVALVLKFNLALIPVALLFVGLWLLGVMLLNAIGR